MEKRKTAGFFRALTVFLAVILVIGSLATVVFADESTAETAADAANAAAEKDGFKLSDVLLVPIGFIIRVCYSLCNNYAIALLLFALVMQVILFPLGVKQQKNTNKQAALRPKESAIRKKYAGRNDQVTQRKMQEEILNLYQQENFNPASGCLPLLIQLPIIFALFAVVRQPLTYITRLSSSTIASLKEQLKSLGVSLTAGYEEISVISYIKENGIAGLKGVTEEMAGRMPNFKMFGGAFDISVLPKDNILSIYILIPILTFVIMIGSQKLTKKLTYRPETNTGAADANTQASMKIMEWMMPLMSVYFSFIVPSAIGVYWMFRNLLSVVQQFVLSKLYPTPKFTEEELLAAEKEYLGKNPKHKPKKDPNAPRPRSLHTIDFDDDDDAPAVPKKTEKKPESGKTRLEAAPLKEDKPSDDKSSK